MKSAVPSCANLISTPPTPPDVLKPVSTALDRFPQIKLDDLAWQMNAAEPVAPNSLADVPARSLHQRHLDDFASDYRGHAELSRTLSKRADCTRFPVTTLSNRSMSARVAALQ